MKRKILDFLRQQPKWRLIVAGLIIPLLVIWAFSGDKTAQNEITFTVKRGDLPISVLEGGSVEALESQEIRSEVKGGQGTKILKIVEEGYQVTPDDVKNGKVLVELDAADIKDRLVQEEIQFQSALATLTDAAQGYEIQRNQNVSNIKAAEQKAQFARMDAEKFLGDKTAGEIIHALELDLLESQVAKLASGEDAEQLMMTAMENNGLPDDSQSGSQAASTNDKPAKPELLGLAPVSSATNNPLNVDFSKYATAEKLGDGSAMQQLRKLMDDLQSAQQQYGLSETKLGGTKRLFEKGFATKTELDTEEISFDTNDLRVKTAKTAYNLFIKYEFPKQAQELISKYEESLRSLEREKKEAISKLAQARARLKGAESRYNIESSQRKELMDQIQKCVIKAQKPGLVVYGGSSEGFYGNTEQIREGAGVRERQPIITIPDMSRMSIKVKVHESYIQKVGKGLKTKIQVDAYPHKKLTGEVTKVALLPDSQNRWFNPDMKVYQTTVTVDGSHDWLKPGMSAKVEILIKQLKGALYVPLQAVTESNGKHYCQMPGGDRREVEIGDFNDEFIEIKNGLKEGEKVSLRTPEVEANEGDSTASPDKSQTQSPSEKKPADAQPKTKAKPGSGPSGRPQKKTAA